MTYKNLLEPLQNFLVRGNLPAGEVHVLTQDSRMVGVGAIYVAIPGIKVDGHQFLADVARQGAAIVVVEEAQKVPASFQGAIFQVPSSREALDILAAQFYEHPSQELFVAAVTGTNGKTTSSHMVESILNAAGCPTAVMGTIDFHFGKSVKPSTHTTPDPLATQKLLREWRGEGAKALSMEVSSHALEMHRVDSIQYDAAIFTNLTRDHMDLHQTMENYVRAKARLFFELLPLSMKKDKRAVINTDDPWSKQMLNSVNQNWTFGIERGDLHARRMDLTLAGTKAEIMTPKGRAELMLQMVGKHNVLNALGAIGIGLHKGVDLDQTVQALSGLRGVRGRLESVPNKKGFHIFVDYAHTDDALINVLSFLKSLKDSSSRVITVFGCGGDRDRGKRPMMAQAAMRLSDLVVVTSDNPRTEDPERIIDDILAAIPKDSIGKKVFVDVDRREGIKKALSIARPNDAILIAGKGHEDYQIVGTTKYPFDDVQVACSILGEQ